MYTPYIPTQGGIPPLYTLYIPTQEATPYGTHPGIYHPGRIHPMVHPGYTTVIHTLGGIPTWYTHPGRHTSWYIHPGRLVHPYMYTREASTPSYVHQGSVYTAMRRREPPRLPLPGVKCAELASCWLCVPLSTRRSGPRGPF